MCSFRTWLPVAVVLGLLAGCASISPVQTDYDPDDDITTYESRSTQVPDLRFGSGSLGSRNQVSVEALGKCDGSGCQPDDVTLVFRSSGSNDLRVANPSVTLTADRLTVRSVSSDRTKKQDAREIDKVTGELARISLSFEEFRRVAEAERVSGSVGSESFTLSHDRRDSFRAFVQQVEGRETKGAAE